MHGLAVYVKERLTFAQDLSLETSVYFYLCFRVALLHSVSYSFFLYRSPSSSLCTVFDSISSDIDEVLSINPSSNVFVFGDFNVHHKDWLTYSGGTDRPFNLFISPNASICSAMAFSLLRNSDHVVVSVSINFPINSKRDALFHCIAYDYSRADWDGLGDHLRDVP